MAVRWLLVATLVLAGCGGEASAATLKSSIRYEKGGGIAGIGHRLTVRPDGRGTTDNREHKRSFRLSAATLRALEGAVAKARLDKTKSPKPGKGADGFAYAIAYDGHEVEWDDFSKDPPKRVTDLAAMLDELYERYAPRCDGNSC